MYRRSCNLLLVFPVFGIYGPNKIIPVFAFLKQEKMPDGEMHMVKTGAAKRGMVPVRNGVKMPYFGKCK